ncbi:MAG: glycosyltransferase family 9 protein [Lentimicrobium sp.]|nr:glycosyltransferase family 9 protein [Lentimicrobium sp.]
MNQVLIIQTASLGDVILSTALAESIHHRFPDASIDYLVKKGYEGLFKGHPFIRKVIIWDKKNNKYANLLKLALGIRKTRYDAVINIQRFFTSGFLTAISGAAIRSGFDKNPFSFSFTHKSIHQIGTGELSKHETLRNHELLGFLSGIETSKPALYPTVEDFNFIKQWNPAKYLTISPASLWFTKQYPVHKWIEFTDKLPADIRVILLGASDDENICKQIIAQTKHPGIISLAGKLGFLQSAAVMKGALMNYVNDSAPMHLASAVNAPVTAIYCSTLPAFGFGPLSDNSAIVEAIPVPECRPCGLHGHQQCPEGHFKCAETIKTEQLLNRLSI